MRLMQLLSTSSALGMCVASHHHGLSGAHDEYLKPQSSRAMGARTVAVIGAGAGGSSAAHHLSQYAEAAGIPINITVFERESHIGGRSTTVHAFNDPSQPIELGASIFVEVNHILVDAVKRFNLSTKGLSKRRISEKNTPQLGVWNGKEFVLLQPAGQSWWDLAKLFWRYGLAPIRTMNLMKSTVGKFLKLYDEPLFPWSSLTQVAETVGLTPDVTGVTGEQFLKQNSVGDLFAQEVVQASTRVNYGSNLGLIHGLETMVCMATDGAMAVEGGNWQIFARMLNATKNASVRLNTSVTSLKLQPDGSYVLHSSSNQAKEEAEANESAGERFDTVVLAGPYQFADLTIDPLPNHVPDKIPYVKLYVTLLASPHLLNPTAFNLPEGTEAPDMILTTLQPGESYGSDPNGVGSPGFFSISIVDTAVNPSTGVTENVYKIFSPKEVSNDFLSQHWGFKLKSGEIDNKDITWIYRKVWNPYPYEYPRVTFDELRLDKNLWYTSPIESFISTMETSALSGKNIAKLIVNDWANSSTQQPVFDWVQNQKPLKAKL